MFYKLLEVRNHHIRDILVSRLILATILITWVSMSAYAVEQCDTLLFNNPSAEGPGYPSGWFNCQGTSNPQPGMFGCNTVASEGNNFIGFHSSDAGGEIIHQALSQAMIPGHEYRFLFDLAVTPNWSNPAWWGGGGYGDHSGYVKVYAGNESCGQSQHIGTTDIIESSMNWVTVEITFTAEANHQYLVFVPFDTAGLWTYFGLDNLRNAHNCACHPLPQTAISASICQGSAYTIGTDTLEHSGEHTAMLSSVQGCDSLVTIDLTVHPVMEIEESVQICSGTSYQGYTETGTYTETYVSALGCDSIRTLELLVTDVIQTYDTMRICQGEQILIGGQTIEEEGAYPEVFQSTSGCDSVHSILVELISPITVQQQLLSCSEEPVQIGSAYYTEEGYYTDSLQSIFGCDSVVITELRYLHDNAILPEDQSFCQGDQVYIDLSEYPVDFMFWNDDFTSPFIIIENNGTHFLDLFWADCHVSDTISAIFHEVPPANIDTSLCVGDELEVGLSQIGGLIAWEDGFVSENLLIEEDYEAYAQIENACGSFDLSIEVSFHDCECPIFIPNSFSPNGDGINEYFEITHLCDFIRYEFYVFDRFGQILFESDRPEKTWNGTFLNTAVAVPNSSYTWLLNYSAISDTGKLEYEMKRGSVTIIR